MEYVNFAGCGLQVSQISLGTMTMGDQVDEKTALEAVDYALDQGVNFFDTANMYIKGKSETIMGKAMAGRRDKFILATKVGQRMREEPNGGGLSRRHILAEFDASLKRLGTDYVDFYYLHMPDSLTPAEETLSALEHLVDSGRVRYIGASNFAAWQVCQLCHLAAGGPAKPVAAQMVYNLLTRGIEQELVPFLKEYGLGLVVYNPLAGGLLTEKYAEKRLLDNTRLTRNAGYGKRYWNEDNLEAWDEIRTIADEVGGGMVQLAMRWLISTGNVDVIITGFSGMDQLRQNLSALDGGRLDAATLAACDKVWEKLAGTRFKYNR